jgi:hypothetical protein
MKYNKLTNHGLNKINPFLNDTIHHVDKGNKTVLIASKDPDLIVDSDGNVRGHSILARKVKVDRAQFMKVYHSGLSNWYDLSKASIKVFAYIANLLKPNSDSFDFDLEDCKTFTGYAAKNTILSAISELIDNKFIARGSNPYKYFVNPTIFFNGDRLTLLDQYEVEPLLKPLPEPKVNSNQLDLLDLIEDVKAEQQEKR